MSAGALAWDRRRTWVGRAEDGPTNAWTGPWSRWLAAGVAVAGTGLVLAGLQVAAAPMAIAAAPDGRAVTLPNGEARNRYHLVLLNRDGRPHTGVIAIRGLPGRLAAPAAPVSVPAGGRVPLDVAVVARVDDDAPRAFAFTWRDAETGQEVGTAPATFNVPDR